MPKKDLQNPTRLRKQEYTDRSTYRTSGLFSQQRQIQRTRPRTRPTNTGPSIARIRELDKYESFDNVIQIKISRKDLIEGGNELEKIYAKAIKKANRKFLAIRNGNERRRKKNQIVVQFYVGSQKTAFAYYYPRNKVFALKAKAPQIALEKFPSRAIREMTGNPIISLIDRKAPIAEWRENKLNIVQPEQHKISKLPLEVVGSNDMELEISGKHVGEIRNTVLTVDTQQSKKMDKAKYSSGIYTGQPTKASQTLFRLALAKFPTIEQITATAENKDIFSKTDRNGNVIFFDKGNNQEVKVAEYNATEDRFLIINLDYFDVLAKKSRIEARTINFANCLEFSPATGAHKWLKHPDEIDMRTVEQLEKIFEDIIRVVSDEESEDHFDNTSEPHSPQNHQNHCEIFIEPGGEDFDPRSEKVKEITQELEEGVENNELYMDNLQEILLKLREMRQQARQSTQQQQQTQNKNTEQPSPRGTNLGRPQ